MKIKIVILTVILCVALSACTVQTDFDIYDFCVRFNKLSQAEILSTRDFLTDKNGMYYSFVTVGKSLGLISIKTDKNDVVQEVCLTFSRDKFNTDDSDEAVDFAFRVFGAYEYSALEDAKKNLTETGFDNDFSFFSEKYERKTVGKYVYTLYSNGFSFTVSAQKNRSD